MECSVLNKNKARAHVNVALLANKLVKEFEKNPDMLKEALKFVNKKESDFYKK